jgi:uncharacterized protein
MVLYRMIERRLLLDRIRKALRRSRVVVLTGPRQSGKTTLARALVPADSPAYFDLEDPAAVARLGEPMTALASLRGLIVIDEVQRRPEIFPVLRVLADRKPLPARFLLLGSASPSLLRQSSESLAGRIEVIEIGGLTIEEVGAKALNRHWQRGGFPRSYLARTNEDSFSWRRNFLQTFLERDVPQLGITIAAPTLLRFWTMVAHMHGSVWSAADPARSLTLGESTIRRYLDLFSSLLLVRQLPPWHENLGKRQIKSPKVYVRDSGLLHTLLGIHSESTLLGHPKLGASWEGYVLEQLLNSHAPDEAYFWGTHQGAELDLLIFKGGRRFGFEIKRVDAPTLTPSMRIAMADLKLAQLTVLYPGTQSYELAPNVRAVPLLSAGSAGLAQIADRAARKRD